MNDNNQNNVNNNQVNSDEQRKKYGTQYNIYHDKEVTDCSGTNLISFALEYLFHYLHFQPSTSNALTMFSLSSHKLL